MSGHSANGNSYAIEIAIELGHQVITAAHLANLSYRTGKKVYWDAERQQVIGV